MPKIKIPVKKNKTQQVQHPSYPIGHERTWVDDFKEKNDDNVKKNFWRIIIICIVLLILLVIAGMVAFIGNSGNTTNTVSVADTFAISSKEQEQMRTDAQDFATGLMYLAYCDDASTKSQIQQDMLSMMAIDTDAYKNVQDAKTDNKDNTQYISSADFALNMTTPVLAEGTQSYAGAYTYTLSVDVGKRDNGGDSATKIATYEISVTFEQAAAADGSGESDWVISNFISSKKNTSK